MNDYFPLAHQLQGLFIGGGDRGSLPPDLQGLSTGGGDWGSLPPDLQDHVLACLPLGELLRVSVVCKSFSEVLGRRTFHLARARLYPKEYFLSPLVFYAEKDSWCLRGFDSKDQVWRKLPFRDRKGRKNRLPPPDPDLFKDFHVAGDVGLFCVNRGKATKTAKLYLYNPLTGATFKLPPLNSPRHPVILHVHVTLAKKHDLATSTFWVIAIGSAAVGTESLSRKTEIYDPVEGKWSPAGDVPGTDFSLNEYQTGVFCESQNLLLCAGFIVNGSKGILAFDVGKREWRENWTCPYHEPIPVTGTALTVYFAIAQLVMCNGLVYLFSEQEAGRLVRHCIDRLDFKEGGEGFTWTRVVTCQRQGNRALLVYPEYTCVPVRENKLCIFNTIERTGVVYDMSSGDAVESSESITPPPREDGVLFHSLNPVGYAFEPSFGITLPEDNRGEDEAKIKEEAKKINEEIEKKKDGLANMNMEIGVGSSTKKAHETK